MLESATELIIGIAGTMAYLYAWNRALGANNPTGGDPRAPEAVRRTWRRRLWQLFFFATLTPYVLFLFFLMEKARSALGITPEKFVE